MYCLDTISQPSLLVYIPLLYLPLLSVRYNVCQYVVQESTMSFELPSVLILGCCIVERYCTRLTGSVAGLEDTEC